MAIPTTFNLHHGDSAQILKQYPDNYFHSVVCDPPYGIEFLGKDWDKNQGKVELWQEVYRVLRPGGFIIAFSATRTYHRIAVNLEDVGFEIRDMVSWVYSSGFPKAQDVGRIIQKRQGVEETEVLPADRATGSAISEGGDSKGGWNHKEATIIKPTSPEALKWSGWKTGLKPAQETAVVAKKPPLLNPAVLARKPMEGSTADNTLKWETGALNIDGSRIEWQDNRTEKTFNRGWTAKHTIGGGEYIKDESQNQHEWNKDGRFPSNIIGDIQEKQESFLLPVEDPEGFKHYAYVPKVGRAERNVGFDLKDIPTDKDGWRTKIEGNHEGTYADAYENRLSKGNNHPTVKPVALMKYLINLVTVPGGKVLDPFMGSGSTGCAAKELGCEFTGVDLNPDYVEISKKRIAAWGEDKKKIKTSAPTTLPPELFGE